MGIMVDYPYAPHCGWAYGISFRQFLPVWNAAASFLAYWFHESLFRISMRADWQVFLPGEAKSRSSLRDCWY